MPDCDSGGRERSEASRFRPPLLHAPVSLCGILRRPGRLPTGAYLRRFPAGALRSDIYWCGIVDYRETLDWIMSFWEPSRPKAQEKALRVLKVPRMRALLERIGSPHLEYPAVLIAGTKGKGSTAAFIADGLRAAGYRVGRYTQPHLVDWRERTWVDGTLIDCTEAAALATKIRPAVEELHRGMRDLGGVTTYEVGTALTLAHFAEKRVNVAVLEIGIGGRLDALNAVDPVLSAVTSISLDHTDVLGDTLEEIATEKAGIFRQGRAAVSAPQAAEAEGALRRAAVEVGAQLYVVGRDEGITRSPAPSSGGGEGRGRARSDWWWSEGPDPTTIDVHGPYGAVSGIQLPLLGDHQRDNAAVAVAALQLMGQEGFQVDAEAIRRGLAAVEWPGRIQVLRRSPLVVVDAAHNEDSALRLAETIRKHFRYEHLILVFGASADKDVAGMARVLGPLARRVIVTGSGHRRAADLEMLEAEFAPLVRDGVETEPDLAAALESAVTEAAAEDLVLVAGSVFLAGKALQLLSSEP